MAQSLRHEFEISVRGEDPTMRLEIQVPQTRRTAAGGYRLTSIVCTPYETNPLDEMVLTHARTAKAHRLRLHIERGASRNGRE